MDLHLDSVTLDYPDGDGVLTAVANATLTVPSGTTTALVGPSGSGKSSLLAVAAGLTPPTRGTVRIGGEPVFAPTTSISEATRVRRERIGVVFQAPQLLASLTALEQLELTAHLRGDSRAEARDRGRALLAAVGLAGREHARPAQLSGGQRQRVAIARALMPRPSVLLVDEPTSALDHSRGVAVVDLITSLARESEAACLLVSHDEDTLGACDRVARIVDGRVDDAVQAGVGA